MKRFATQRTERGEEPIRLRFLGRTVVALHTPTQCLPLGKSRWRIDKGRDQSARLEQPREKLADGFVQEIAEFVELVVPTARFIAAREPFGQRGAARGSEVCGKVAEDGERIGAVDPALEDFGQVF